MQTIVIASTMRTGSTLLASALESVGIGKGLSEWKHPWELLHREVRAMHGGDLDSYLDYLYENNTQGGYLLLQVHWVDWERTMKEDPLFVDKISPVRFIRNLRIDHAAQAVSLHVSNESRRPTSLMMPTGRTASYDEEKIAACYHEIIRGEEEWANFLLDYRPYDVVSYEELDMDLVGVLDRLGFPGTPEVPFKKQRLPHHAEWAERFAATIGP